MARKSGKRKPGPRPASHSGSSGYKRLKQQHTELNERFQTFLDNRPRELQELLSHYKQEFQAILDNLEIQTNRQIAIIQAKFDRVQADNVILVQHADTRRWI